MSVRRSCAIGIVVLALAAVHPRLARADGVVDDEAAAVARAQRLRRVGIGLSLSAIACEVATLALWGAAVGIIDSRSSEYGSDPPAYWPVFGLAVATTVAVPLLLASGVPLWSIGAHRLNAPKRARVTISPTGVVRF